MLDVDAPLPLKAAATASGPGRSAGAAGGDLGAGAMILKGLKDHEEGELVVAFEVGEVVLCPAASVADDGAVLDPAVAELVPEMLNLPKRCCCVLKAALVVSSSLFSSQQSSSCSSSPSPAGPCLPPFDFLSLPVLEEVDLLVEVDDEARRWLGGADAGLLVGDVGAARLHGSITRVETTRDEVQRGKESCQTVVSNGRS